MVLRSSSTAGSRLLLAQLRHDNKPIELWSNKVTFEKIKYIHNNPVEAGLVFKPEHYLYSSAIDYSGEKGMIDGVVVVK